MAFNVLTITRCEALPEASMKRRRGNVPLSVIGKPLTGEATDNFFGK